MSDRREAAALREKLGCPIHNKILHKEVGRGELDYEVYVRTRELLALQTPADELVVPDEMLFLVVHQTQELWLKCAVFEATNLVERLDGDKLFPALGVCVAEKIRGERPSLESFMAKAVETLPGPIRHPLGGHGDRGTSPPEGRPLPMVISAWGGPRPSLYEEALFPDPCWWPSHGKRRMERQALRETSRGPRGLRKGVV